MRIISLCVPVLCFVRSAQAAASEILTVTRDKLHMLRLPKAGSTVIIGNPALADIRVEGSRLIFIFGRTAGETNFVVLDKRGREIVNYDLIVTPAAARHVTVNRGANVVSTLSCADRCTAVQNTGSAAAPATPNVGAAAGANGTAAGAPAATQAVSGEQ